MHRHTMSKQCGNAVSGGKEDAASVHRCTMSMQSGTTCGAREEDAAIVCRRTMSKQSDSQRCVAPRRMSTALDSFSLGATRLLSARVTSLMDNALNRARSTRSPGARV